jgi:hypothetical protein
MVREAELAVLTGYTKALAGRGPAVMRSAHTRKGRSIPARFSGQTVTGWRAGRRRRGTRSGLSSLVYNGVVSGVIYPLRGLAGMRGQVLGGPGLGAGDEV